MSIRSCALSLCAVTSIIAGSPALSQSSPFVPDPKINPAELNKAIDARIKQMQPKSGSEAGSTPGVPGPLAPSAASGGIAPFGPPGGIPGAAGVPGAGGAPGMIMPGGPVQMAMAAGARFVGCIDRKHYFSAKGGGRLAFRPKDIDAAVREGAIPSCR